MKSLKQFKEEQMKNADFVKEYEDIQPELDVIRAIVEARTSQNMTQKELAERTGINQADISKLENGTRNPAVAMSSKAMSLKDRIKNYAKNNNIAAQVVLQNYMFECLLARLSVSEYSEKFVVKGGMLIAAIVGLDTRSTMDLVVFLMKIFELVYGDIILRRL